MIQRNDCRAAGLSIRFRQCSSAGPFLIKNVGQGTNSWCSDRERLWRNLAEITVQVLALGLRPNGHGEKTRASNPRPSRSASLAISSASRTCCVRSYSFS